MYRFKCKQCGSHELIEEIRSSRDIAVHSVEDGCPVLMSGKQLSLASLICGCCGMRICYGDETHRLAGEGWLEKLPNTKIINLKDLPTTDVRMPNGNIRQVDNWNVMSALLSPEEAKRIRKMYLKRTIKKEKADG